MGSAAISDSQACPHADIFQGSCLFCGAGVLINLNSDVSQESASLDSLEVLSVLSSQQRLCLVLDLDETLVHTIVSSSSDGCPTASGHPLFGFTFALGDQHFFVFLRPGLMSFLHSAMERFDVAIYSNGTHDYVIAVLEHLVGATSINRYFAGGVFARPHQFAPTLKELARCMCENELTLIVDDRFDVWAARDAQNILQIDPFQPNPLLFDHHSEDPCTSDNALERLDQFLGQVHEAFHTPENGFWDVRDILRCCQAIGNQETREMEIVIRVGDSH